MKSILIEAEIYNEIKQSLSDGKKIQAIKILRNAAGCGLREAKLTIDNLVYEQSGKGKPSVGGYKLVVTPIIKEIVCDFGSGPIRIDLETMELKVLTDLHTIGIDACAKILDLCQALKDFSTGTNLVKEVKDES